MGSSGGNKEEVVVGTGKKCMDRSEGNKNVVMDLR